MKKMKNILSLSLSLAMVTAAANFEAWGSDLPSTSPAQATLCRDINADAKKYFAKLQSTWDVKKKTWHDYCLPKGVALQKEFYDSFKTTTITFCNEKAKLGLTAVNAAGADIASGPSSKCNWTGTQQTNNGIFNGGASANLSNATKAYDHLANLFKAKRSANQIAVQNAISATNMVPNTCPPNTTLAGLNSEWKIIWSDPVFGAELDKLKKEKEDAAQVQAKMGVMQAQTGQIVDHCSEADPSAKLLSSGSPSTSPAAPAGPAEPGFGSSISKTITDNPGTAFLIGGAAIIGGGLLISHLANEGSGGGGPSANQILTAEMLNAQAQQAQTNAQNNRIVEIVNPYTGTGTGVGTVTVTVTGTGTGTDSGTGTGSSTGTTTNTTTILGSGTGTSSGTGTTTNTTTILGGGTGTGTSTGTGTIGGGTNTNTNTSTTIGGNAPPPTGSYLTISPSQPGTGAVGQNLPAFTVTLVQSNGAIYQSNDFPITVSCTTSCSLTGTTTVSTQDGIAVFDNISITAAQSGVVLNFSGSGVSSVHTASFNVQ